MSNEDKARFSFLMIVTVIVMVFNVQTKTEMDRRGLNMLDMAFNDYISSTARSWADASINQTVQEELEIAQPQIN